MAGVWELTGENTAAATFAGFFTAPMASGTIVIRVTLTVSADGNSLEAPYSYTVVGSDGTVLDSGQGLVAGTRMAVEPVDAAGTPLAGMPTWTPEQEATPTS